MYNTSFLPTNALQYWTNYSARCASINSIGIEGIDFCLVLRLDLSLLHAWLMETKNPDHIATQFPGEHSYIVGCSSLSCICSAYGSPGLSDPPWGVHWIKTSSPKKHSHARIKARVVTLPSLPIRSKLFLMIHATCCNLLLFITEDGSRVANA